MRLPRVAGFCNLDCSVTDIIFLWDTSALKTTLASAWPKDPGLDSSDADWETVVERIEKVRKSYENEAERNKFRSYVRDGKEVCNVLANLVNLIPDEKGLSILKAGLSFLFQVRIGPNPAVRSMRRDAWSSCVLKFEKGLGAADREPTKDPASPFGRTGHAGVCD